MPTRAALFLAITVLLAGCTGDPHERHSMGLDTGDIAPGAEKSLMFHEAGTFELHCHPHPWMEHRVSVVEGGPASARVLILDDPSNDTAFRFEPQNVTIGVGGTVTYANMGTFAHTATQKDE